MFGLRLLAGFRPGQKQKTHSRCQPWVLFEIQFKLDNHPRRPG
jgi:hypothetical protein